MKPLIVGYKHCDRCRGEGFIKHYSYVDGGVCFKCKGSGLVKERKPKKPKSDLSEANIDELPY